ncbi:hypothetical protein F383_20948 [Gossypium arboreum]|uniref:Uncharacterized protein n=1 Tax=Gossypium arboreum TaxID=29729 RepID=A0A0B0NV50_GOSAR|nr:hypothetical protein F383_20948 [Gossypium arboreum]
MNCDPFSLIILLYISIRLKD